jgi:hypothetical protein
LQQHKPVTQATLDVDATILESDKQAAKPTYDGRRGYQPVFVVWAEQDMLVADEFRDGNVPAGSGNQRVVQKAVEALPPGVEQIRVRGDSALYEHALLDWMARQNIGVARRDRSLAGICLANRPGGSGCRAPMGRSDVRIR